MNEQTLSVTGMTCADCARHVEKALKTLTDIVAADVTYPQGVAHIRSIQPLSLDQLNASLPKNYRVAAAPSSHADTPAAKPSRLNQALDSLGGLFKPRSDVDTKPTDAEQRLRVAVIGTGGAAMASALKAAELGAHVTI
ncbi:Heavy metal transport/detoxification protein domain protein, partial [mine drainage metagenome]